MAENRGIGTNNLIEREPGLVLGRLAKLNHLQSSSRIPEESIHKESIHEESIHERIAGDKREEERSTSLMLQKMSTGGVLRVSDRRQTAGPMDNRLSGFCSLKCALNIVEGLDTDTSSSDLCV